MPHARLPERKASPHAVFRQLVWSVRRGFVAFFGDDPWEEDAIDLRAAGLKSRSKTGRRRHPGVADLAGIPQPWLRDLLRRRTEAERPTSNEFNRWHRGVVLAAQGMNRLPGGGTELSSLDFTHIQAAFEEIAAARNSRTGKLCASSYRSKLLGDFFALLDFGRLTGQLEDAPGAFARHGSHSIPQEDTNEDEIGRAIPEHVIRQLDAQLDTFPVDIHYGDLAPEEVRAMFHAIYVVLRDCGRRPSEVASLPRNCLEREGDEVSLIWHNSKGRRLRRRLPIVTETVQTIERWQKIRGYIAAPPDSETYLFPAATDAAGLPHLGWITLGAAMRKWVDSLPELDSGTVDTHGNPLPFGKSLIFPYAFRHPFAQRHADAGTPLDVLRDLMDHDDPRTTLGYYRVSLKRKREAVKTLSLQVVDRHGADSPCSPLAYEQRSVAVPFGGCTEPSNVKAGGQACPIRFQCSGCGFYRPDPSYLPSIEDHINSLRADRETALAMDAASFVIDNITARITSYEEVSEKMRRRMVSMPDDERAELEEAATVLRRVRAGDNRKMLPLTVIQPENN
ncbi:tyrosine-type recombinase/integrase [Streptomyces chiangmaiensis]|uniref:Tyrosine-type recombinase/integrase n=1 Tax=Streptomyces chiangmaiensis TaxID=766497 RepID=A0ABU7FR73_9ACTN|nr:tyrosine-type recombinase/integrase [Streptomyces chiangmaiensis]MED7826474.1 tyrosine-type recombinase/integrase [Streptomyces chiangmaiensis]